MTIVELLAVLSPDERMGPGEAQGLELLESRLDAGHAALGATLLPDGSGPGITRAHLLVSLAAAVGSPPDLVVVSLGTTAREVLARRLPHLPVQGASPAPETAAQPQLGRELAERFEATAGLDPEERAASLMEWIMGQVDASRCALVPMEAGTLGTPLAFHVRGRAAATPDRRRLPRTVLEAAARTRQPIVSHDVDDPTQSPPPSASVERQGIRSYMAVPVVFRGDVLGVAYVDRFDRPRRFSLDEQATFQALAYELARPVMTLRDQQREREFDALRDELLTSRGATHPEVRSPALAAVLERAADVAPHADESLLILGETGVGKEWLARHVHELSRRRGPFVAVNLSAIPSDLFESELMGSTRGAFTGAVDRKGRIAEAEGGTLFLDEIGDLELIAQVRLLRFLQDRHVRPVGGQQEREVDVRLVAATNRPLHALVRKGEFRADLLHRFAPPLIVPPLRERRDEILPLATAWLAAKARQRGLPTPVVTPDALRLLQEHAWPGNVRQLQAVLSHAILVARGQPLDAALLTQLMEPPDAEEPQPTPTAARPSTLADFRASRDADEAQWLRASLAAHDGNVEATARALGCPGTSLRHLLARHGLLLKKS